MNLSLVLITLFTMAAIAADEIVPAFLRHRRRLKEIQAAADLAKLGFPGPLRALLGGSLSPEEYRFSSESSLVLAQIAYECMRDSTIGAGKDIPTWAEATPEDQKAWLDMATRLSVEISAPVDAEDLEKAA